MSLARPAHVYVVSAHYPDGRMRATGTVRTVSASAAVAALEARLANDGDPDDEVAHYRFTAEDDGRPARARR